jgi:hypothetical protein
VSGITHELFKNQIGEIAGVHLSAVLFFSVLLAGRSLLDKGCNNVDFAGVQHFEIG